MLAERWFPVLYLVAIVAMEVLISRGIPLAGMVLGLALLAVLPLHAAFASRPQGALLTALTLVPLVRVVSLALPLGGLPLAAAYLVASIPLALGVVAAIWALELRPSQIGLRVGQPLVQLGIVLLGVPLGLLRFVVIGSSSLGIGGLGNQLFTSLVLVVSIAFLEEVIYRGILQTTALAAMGRVGLVYVSVVFAVSYLGNDSLASVAIAFPMGLLFAVLVARTGSLLGVTLAHGLALVLAEVMLPVLGVPGL